MRTRSRQLRIVVLGLGVTAIVLMGGLALAQAKPAQKAAEPPVEPTGDAKDVLQKAEGYQSWPKFPEYEKGAKQSKGHGGDFVVAFYNDVAAPAVQGATPYPDGSILVKENRPQPDAKPDALTTMAKRGGSWFFVKSTLDGKVFTEKGKPVAGAVKDCVGCHAMAAKDMVFSK
jgi:hypothetical protein